MSRSLNHVTLMGNLTRDPELRAIASGNSVCQFGLALNREYINPNTNERVEKTTFVDVVAWGRLAETVSQYCQKGKQVVVTGRLESSSWEQDGQKRSKLEVVATEVIFTSGSGRPDPDRSQPNARSAPESNTTQAKARPKTKTDSDQSDKINIDDVPF